MATFVLETDSNEAALQKMRHIQLQAEHAIKMGMFLEWLESFVGAWNETKDPYQAANAGIIEWDL